MPTRSRPEPGAAGQSGGNFVEEADRQAYMTVAVGDLSATLEQFNSERSSLVATIAAANKDMRAGLASGAGRRRRPP